MRRSITRAPSSDSSPAAGRSFHELVKAMTSSALALSALVYARISVWMYSPTPVRSRRAGR